MYEGILMKPALISTTKGKCREHRGLLSHFRTAVDVLMPILDIDEVGKTRTPPFLKLY